jgi:hypothetical protein
MCPVGLKISGFIPVWHGFVPAPEATYFPSAVPMFPVMLGAGRVQPISDYGERE